MHPEPVRPASIPIAPAAPPSPHLPRLRALALLGRRPEPAAPYFDADVRETCTVAVVVAVEVPPFLLAVERIVGGIEIEHDADRRLAVRIKENIDWQPFDGTHVVVELVMPVLADLARVLQPVERRLAGECTAGLVEHGGQRRIEAQRVVIDQILVAEREAEDALAQQICRQNAGRRRVSADRGSTRPVCR